MKKKEKVKKPFVQSNKKRYASYWGSVLMGYVAPVAVVGVQFGFFKPETSAFTQLSGGVIAMAMIMVFRFYKDIIAWIKTLTGGNIDENTRFLKTLVVIAVILAIFYFVVDEMLNVLIWWIGCEASAVPLRQIHDKHVPEEAKLKALARKERKEQIKNELK